MADYRWARPRDPKQISGMEPGWAPAEISPNGDVYLPGCDVGWDAESYELGPAIPLPAALRALEPHTHRGVRHDSHRFDSTGTVVVSEFCECGAVRQDRLSPADLEAGRKAELGPWVRV